MTTSRSGIVTVIIFAFIFTVLFYKHDFGLNILLLEFLIIAWLAISKQIDFSSRKQLVYCVSVIITAAAVVLVFSPYVIVVNFLAFFIFIGSLIYPRAKSLVSVTALSFCNIFTSQNRFFKSWQESRNADAKPTRWRKIGIFIIPLFIILFFIAIYRGSSPFFDRLVTAVTDFIGEYIVIAFEYVDFLLVFTYMLGLAISNMVFNRVAEKGVIASDSTATDTLQRNKQKRPRNFKLTALKDEHKVGIFLLIVLNLTLLIVNILDIYWVWFNFEWNGQYLKQFVHEGTYLLLLSILTSIGIVLYFFRGNINFYGKSNFLRKLSYIWLAQNAVLTISVAVRNFHYIEYFALAYKRIALILFLLLTLYGLFTVFVKVSQKKSSFFLFRTNAFALYLILVLSATVNWENIIVKYNFEHARHSFLDFSYASTFPDKSLPYLDKSPSEIAAIKDFQKKKFPFETYDMTAEEYLEAIDKRKKDFIVEYQTKSYLSWNLPEYLAYNKLK